jgi:aspartate aminotransferase
MPMSKRIAAYQEKGSWIRKLFEEGAQMAADGSGKPVYDFSIGNPDLEPPAEFTSTLKELAASPETGTHKYMANVGYLETRQAVAGSLARDHDLPFAPENITMTVGAGGAINVAFKALLDPGEEVIAIAPYFVEYRFYTENHGGQLVEARSAADFDFDLADLEAKITDRTRIVVITNPNNPTGVLYSQESLDALGDLLRRKSEGRERPIFLVDDAPYRKLVFDVDRCTSSFNAYENTLMGTSHSKDLGLPGERIGFLAISPRLEGWQKLAGAAAFANRTLGFVNAPALMQRVAARLQDVTIDLDWYRRKRDRLYGALTEMGYEMPYPGGAFYMFPKAPGGDDLAFINKLKEKRVLVVPGSGFGSPGYFRISYCCADDKIEGALPAFAEAIREMG